MVHPAVPHCAIPSKVEHESATVCQSENALDECARQLVPTRHRTERYHEHRYVP